MKNKISLIKVFVKRLDLVMTSLSITTDLQERSKELGLICDVSPQAARKWLTGKSLPDYDKMLLIAERFSVTMSYLLGEINVKNINEGDKNSILKTGAIKGAITIDITENMFFDEMKTGDTAICHPCTDITINNAIYMLQSTNSRFFRKLSYNENKELVISYEDKGKKIINTYTDQSMIELFLSSLVGRVEAVIRKLSSN